MELRVSLEDPAQPEIIHLLEDGERYSASLYPAQSNHHLPLDALCAAHIRFLVARDRTDRAVATGALALSGSWAELKRMWSSRRRVAEAYRKSFWKHSKRRPGRSRCVVCGWKPASKTTLLLLFMDAPASSGVIRSATTDLTRLACSCKRSSTDGLNGVIQALPQRLRHAP